MEFIVIKGYLLKVRLGDFGKARNRKLDLIPADPCCQITLCVKAHNMCTLCVQSA